MELLILFCAVISAKRTYHRPYGADSAFNTTSDGVISPSFIAATYNADELKTFLNRSPEYLAVYCMTVLFAAWHFSLIYCFTLVISIKAYLSFIGFGSDWCPGSLCEAPNSTNIPTDIQGSPVQFTEQVVMKLICLYMKYNHVKKFHYVIFTVTFQSRAVLHTDQLPSCLLNPIVVLTCKFW